MGVSMVWGDKSVEDLRKELVCDYHNGIPMVLLCRKYNISRKTAYKWINRCIELGLEEGVKDYSKAPKTPALQYEESILEQIFALKLRKGTWGPRKLIARLQQDHPELEWPSENWVYKLLKEKNLIIKRKHRKHVAGTHPLADVNYSNDVWAVDFKGWFLTGDRAKCEPLTITDGYSRYLIGCNHINKKTAEYVWQRLEHCFYEYGTPKRIRTDNGPPFGSTGIGRLTPLSVKLIQAGIIPEWINPGHPEENGRHERFHLTLKQEIANPPAHSLREQERRMTAFQEEYNYERPHEALAMKTPGEYYQKGKSWDGILRKPEYDREKMEVRKVGQSGCIWVHQNEYYIGTTLTGEYIGITEDLKLYYGPIELGILKIGESVERPKLKKKPIIRRL